MRNICFTDHDGYRQEFWLGLVGNGLDYVVLQREAGDDTGKVHLQGYAELTKQMRFNAIKELIGNGVHVERRRSTQKKAIDYCKKLSTRLEGPWEAGEMKNQGKRSDLLLVKDDIDAGATIRDIRDNYWESYCKYRGAFKEAIADHDNEDDIVKEVHVLWGDAGTGKTRYVFDHSDRSKLYIKDGSKWFDGYKGKEVVLIDDYQGTMELSLFKRILDRYPARVEVKGGYVDWIPKKIYITSNRSPVEWYPTASEQDQAAILRRLTTVTHYGSGPLHACVRTFNKGK